MVVMCTVNRIGRCCTHLCVCMCVCMCVCSVTNKYSHLGDGLFVVREREVMTLLCPFMTRPMGVAGGMVKKWVCLRCVLQMFG